MYFLARAIGYNLPVKEGADFGGQESRVQVWTGSVCTCLLQVQD